MSTVAASSSTWNIRATLAPRWHTAALVALQLAVALTGTLLQHSNAASRSGATLPRASAAGVSLQYAAILVVNWSLVLYVSRLFRGRNALPQLLGKRWGTKGRALADLALAFGCFVLIMSLEIVFVHLFRVGRNAAIASLLPSTEAERLAWVVLAASVGFCEEVVYRGYLQTQLGAFTRHAALGVVLQAVLFGAAHLEQGLAAALRAGLYGLLLGVLAHFRGSLLPGIGCHVGIDLVGGLSH